MAQAITAQQHQDIPFEQVVELAQPVRSLAHSPLFQVMFAWQNKQGEFNLPGLELVPLTPSFYRSAKFDLTLFLQEAGQTVVGGIEMPHRSSNRLRSNATWDTSATCLKPWLPTTTRLSIACPYSPSPSAINCSTAGTTPRPSSPGTSACMSCLKNRYARAGCRCRGLRETATQLCRTEPQSQPACTSFESMGVKPDARVAICAERSFEMVVGLLAVLKAGRRLRAPGSRLSARTAPLHDRRL